jgi:ribose transport system permease protein
MALVVVFFSWLRPNFCRPGQHSRHPAGDVAVNGVLGVAVTLVIITGGIDLSVGTLMTFCAVMPGCPDLPRPAAAARHRGRHPHRVQRADFRFRHRQDENAALHRHARHDADPQGPVAGHSPAPSRSISTTRPASTRSRSARSSAIPALPIPNGVLILFAVAHHRLELHPEPHALGRYIFALGSNEEAVRLSGVNVDRWKIAVYALAGCICGVAGLLILPPQLGAAGAGAGL